jgi:predicted lipoprotein
MKTVFKYIVAIVIVLTLAYYSVDIKNLEEVKEQQLRAKFNASQYARNFWDNRLNNILGQAIDVGELIKLFNTNMPEAVRSYGKAPGVSRVYAYLLKGQGKIVNIGKDFIDVSIAEPLSVADIRISTGNYIPGNAVRDASGLVDVSQFSDTMKFNEISGEINKIVVKEVITPFLEKNPKTGQSLIFFGSTQAAQDETEERMFGRPAGDDSKEKEFQLVKVVPIRLELE